MADEIAYRDLQPGETIQAGDQWRAESGQWSQIDQSLVGQTTGVRARRPYNITELLRQRDQAGHEYRLAREALGREQAAHKITMANGLQACKERDDAERALKMARASLDETRAAREFVIEERNEAERHLEEERELHQITAKERDECQQQCKHLQAALEEVQRRRDAATGVDAPTVAEVVENILSALEIASHALESLADTGTNDEVAHWSGFIAAVQVVRKIKESTK